MCWHRTGLSALIGLALWAVSPTASAQREHLEAAVALYAEGRVMEAREALDRAEAEPLPEPADVVSLHLHRGLVLATIGEIAAARAAFAIACAIDPHTSRPPELGPASRAAFDDVCPSRHPLTLGHALSERGTLSAAVTGDGAALVARIRVRAASGTDWAVDGASAALATDVPEAALEAGLVLEALTSSGACIARVSIPPVERTRPLLPVEPVSLPPIEPTVEVGAVRPEALAFDMQPVPGRQDDTLAHWLWTIGGVLAVGTIAAIIGGVVVADESRSRVLEPPRIIP